MSNTDHTARPDSWARITEQAGWGDPYADLILEFSARVERLEQAQQQGNSSASLTSSAPAPSTPAGQGELVRSVALAIGQDGDAIMWKPEARRAILAVADWLQQFGFVGAVAALRREVGR